MADSQMRFFNRVGHVEVDLNYNAVGDPFTDENKNKVTLHRSFKGLDFKFKIDKPLACACLNADISIMGLSLDHIHEITSWTAEGLAYARRNRIRVYAGYADSSRTDNGEMLLFDGDIINAIPSSPPDMWVNIRARSGHYRMNHVVNKFFPNKDAPSALKMTEDEIKEKFFDKEGRCKFTFPPKYLFEQCFKEIGCECKWDVKRKIPDTEKYPGLLVSGTEQDLVRMLYNVNRSKFALTEEIITEAESKDKAGMSRFVVSDASVDAGNPIKVSSRDGMIGIPKVDFSGVQVTKFLDTSIERLGFIQLESKMIPSADGIYRIYEVIHEGHLRGQHWQTTMKCWRFYNKEQRDAYFKKLGLIGEM